MATRAESELENGVRIVGQTTSDGVSFSGFYPDDTDDWTLDLTTDEYNALLDVAGAL